MNIEKNKKYNYKSGKTIKFFSFFIFLFFISQSLYAARLKDLISIKGVRSNQLVGYGLVVGLNKTGDKKGSELTVQSLANMMENMGVRVNKDQLNVENVAAVMVVATMPPFAKIGSKIDIAVSSIGTAKSLENGTLLLTPLKGVDGKVYALAQGYLSVGKKESTGRRTQQNLLNAKVVNGATIEKEIDFDFNLKQEIIANLKNPDFTTVSRMAKVINNALGNDSAQILDSGTIKLKIPPIYEGKVAEFVAQIENLDVVPDLIAKVVLNEKTGTVVIGENVKISSIALSHGNLSIVIKKGEDYPSSVDKIKATEDTAANTDEDNTKNANVMLLPANTTINDLVRALNYIGVSPSDLMSIFKSLKAAGALQAELEFI